MSIEKTLRMMGRTPYNITMVYADDIDVSPIYLVIQSNEKSYCYELLT